MVHSDFHCFLSCGEWFTETSIILSPVVIDWFIQIPIAFCLVVSGSLRTPLIVFCLVVMEWFIEIPIAFCLVVSGLPRLPLFCVVVSDASRLLLSFGWW